MRILFKTLMLFFITTALIAGLSTIPSVKKHAVVNTVIILPQGNNFEQEWKKVDSLEKKGLTRSAIEVIDKIYAAAIAEKNTSQSVKSIIYRLKFESYIEEDSYIKSINDLKKEADNSFFPLKPILHSVLAEVYWRYYQNNRWRFLNRTETVNFIPEDIRTWDLKKIFNETISNYHYSLLSSDSLKRIPISYLQDIIKNNGDVLQQKESISLRPTVYDFLAHRAVDFFMNEESGLTSPAYKFEINNPSFFSSAENFSQLNVSSQDSFSLKFHAIKLLQSLLSFHLSEYVHPSAEAAAGAIIDADLKRLKFIRNNSILENKDSLFLAALNVLQTKYGSTNASASVSYEIALYHFEQGNGYNPLDTEETESSLKWKKKEAMNICEETIKKFPESKGAKNCKNLVSKINEKSLSLIAEDVNIPNTPFRSLLKYKNTDSVYFRVISINFDEHKNKTRRKYGKELAAYYSSLKPHLEWTVLLPEDKDYNPHSAEVKIPSLPEGFYVLLIGTTPSFSYSQNSISWMPLWVSDISYVTRQKNDGSFDVSVFNRTNGSPLKGVSAEIYYQHYSYISRDYEEKKLGTYKTDENGYFSIPPSSDYRNFYIDFSYEKDRLNNGNSYYQYRPYKDNKRKIHTHFFTDRSIYRPGQTIYFKGIVIESDANNEKPEIKTGFSSTVNFYDVNYQKVADLKLTFQRIFYCSSRGFKRTNAY
jgi:hypothetical protein